MIFRKWFVQRHERRAYRTYLRNVEAYVTMALSQGYISPDVNRRYLDARDQYRKEQPSCDTSATSGTAGSRLSSE